MKAIHEYNRRQRAAEKRPTIRVESGQPVPLDTVGVVKFTGNRTVRKLTYRYRRQLAPLAVMAVLAGLGWALHHQRGGVAVALLLGALSGACVWLIGRRRLDRPTERVYAAGVVAACTAWLAVAAEVGVAPPMPAILLPVGCLLAGPWWWHYRIRPTVLPAPDALDAAQRWDERVGGKDGALKGSRLVDVLEVGHGWTGTIMLDSGRMHTDHAIAATAMVTSAFDLPIGSVSIEATDDGVASKAKLLVIPDNPLHNVLPWPGPSLDPETGTAHVGLYVDGEPVPWQFWIPGSGAVQSLVSGAQGSGKSRFLEQLVAESMLSDRVLPWIGDPQMGQSLPEWNGLVDWYCVGHHACLEMLQATYRVMMARAQDLATEEWTDDRGRRRVGRESFEPSPERPLLVVVLDEAHVALKDKDAIKIVEDIGKMGRKTGVELILVTQVPSVEQLGGSIVIRSMMASGNVMVFRTGDRLSGAMAFNGALPVDPSKLPRTFPNGSKTHGLGFALSETARPVPARAWLPGDAQDIAAAAPQTELELVSVRAAGRSYRARNDPDRTVVDTEPKYEAPVLFAAPEPAATSRDTIAQLLPEDGSPIRRGDILLAARDKGIKSISTLNSALAQLVKEGRAVKGDRGMYARAISPADGVVQLSPEQTEQFICNVIATANAHSLSEIEFFLAAAGLLLERDEISAVLDRLVHDGRIVQNGDRYESTEAHHG